MVLKSSEVVPDLDSEARSCACFALDVLSLEFSRPVLGISSAAVSGDLAAA